MDYTKYITDGIEHTCKTFKRRTAGTQSCKDAQNDMAEQMKGCVDEVRVQKFKIHPRAFMGSIPLLEGCSLINAALFIAAVFAHINWLAILSAVLTVLSVILFVIEFVLYIPFTEKFMKRYEGQNTYMVRKAKNEAKRRIVIVGHADAAFQMPVMNYFPRPLAYIVIGCGVLIFILTFIFSNLLLADFLSALTLRIFAYILIGLMVVSSPLLAFVDFLTVVDGANDNLTGCYTAMSFLKEMADNDFRFDETEVCCLITDGEEAGLRGARAFARANVEELLDINTIVIAVDTIRELKELRIFARGINYTESNSEEACDLIKFAGLKHGIDIPTAEFYPGACDSEAFSVVGVKSIGVCAISFQPADYYHNVKDTYDNMDPSCIAEVRSILKDAIEMFDKTGKTF